MPVNEGTVAEGRMIQWSREDSLDDEFPLGDGVVELSAFVTCPYCGEALELAVDPGGGAAQQYIEDCEVCCRPMRVSVRWDADGAAHAEAVADDDG
jgi:hypothetical protein